MASQITLILWTDHPADNSLASDLAQAAAAQVYRSSSQQAAVVSATSVDIQVHDIEAAVAAFAPTPAEVPAPVVEASPVPDVTTEVSAAPAAVDAPVAEVAPAVVTPDVTSPAVPEGTTGASAQSVPDPALPVVTSDEHMAVLVQLFEGLTDEQKAQLDTEVKTMEDAHAALEAIYTPLIALEATPPAVA